MKSMELTEWEFYLYVKELFPREYGNLFYECQFQSVLPSPFPHLPSWLTSYKWPM